MFPHARGERIACSQWVCQSGWDLLCGGGRRAQRGDAALPVVVLQLGRGGQRVAHLLHLVMGRLGFGFLFAERLLEGAAQLQGRVDKTNAPWVNITGQDLVPPHPARSGGHARLSGLHWLVRAKREVKSRLQSRGGGREGGDGSCFLY